MAGAPQLQLLFLAISLLGSVATAGFVGAWLAQRRVHAWWAAAGQIVGLAASWYCVSMSLTLFNRVMLGFTAFNFPITMSLSHMAIKGVLGVVLAAEVHRRTVVLAPGAPPPPAGWLARQRAVFVSLLKSQRLTRRVFSRILVPLGTTTALDVWLSAVSLQTLEISVYTTAKSCALIFTLAFSLAARLQQPTWGVMGTVLMIGAGVILCSVKPAGVDALGLVCVLIAAACGAARWVLTEQFYKRPGSRADALVLIALLSPITVLTLVPGLGWEAPRMAAHSPVHSSGDVGVVLCMTVGGGVLAFLLLIIELQLVGLTSALTLNVIGHLKDVVVIGLAIPVLHEELSPINAAGVALTLVATLLYSVHKSRAHSEAAADAAAVARARQLLDETWVADPEPGDGLEAAGGGSGEEEEEEEDKAAGSASAAALPLHPHSPSLASSSSLSSSAAAGVRGYSAVATRTPAVMDDERGGSPSPSSGGARSSSPSGAALLARGGGGQRGAARRYQSIAAASGARGEEDEDPEEEDEEREEEAAGQARGRRPALSSRAQQQQRGGGDEEEEDDEQGALTQGSSRGARGGGLHGGLRLSDDALGPLIDDVGASGPTGGGGAAAPAPAASTMVEQEENDVGDGDSELGGDDVAGDLDVSLAPDDDRVAAAARRPPGAASGATMGPGGGVR